MMKIKTFFCKLSEHEKLEMCNLRVPKSKDKNHFFILDEILKSPTPIL